MVGALPLVRRLEHVQGSEDSSRNSTHCTWHGLPRCQPRTRTPCPGTTFECKDYGRHTHRLPRHGTEPRARRGNSARVAHTHRRRTGNRQINAHAANHNAYARKKSALRERRRKRKTNQAPRRTHRKRHGRLLRGVRNDARTHIRQHIRMRTRHSYHRLDTNHFDRDERKRAGKPVAGARVRRRAA